MAAIIVKDEIEICRDRALIWSHLTDISSWRRWAKIIRRAAVYGPIRPGTEFKFISGKWDFEGTITDVVPQESFVCNARSVGLHLRISWKLAQREDGAKVSANIEASGWIANLLKSKVRRNLQDDLFSWLYALKTASERGVGPESSARSGLSKGANKRRLSGPLGFLFRRDRDNE